MIRRARITTRSRSRRRLSVPPVVPNAQVPAARAAAINAMADALAEVNAYGTAAQITLDRYGGASAAKDLAWASVQTSAYLEYKRLMGTAAITASERISDLIGIAALEGITSVIVPPDRIIAAQQQLSTTGFTAQQIADAHAAGLSDEEIEAVRQSIINADPLELSRENDVVVKMQELGERLRTLGNAMLYPQVFAPSFSVSGGKLLRPEATYGNTMAQVFESRTTIRLGNPLTQTATIDVTRASGGPARRLVDQCVARAGAAGAGRGDQRDGQHRAGGAGSAGQCAACRHRRLRRQHAAGRRGAGCAGAQLCTVWHAHRVFAVDQTLRADVRHCEERAYARSNLLSDECFDCFVAHGLTCTRVVGGVAVTLTSPREDNMFINHRSARWLFVIAFSAAALLISLTTINQASAQDNGPQSPQVATGSSFTYQGRLIKNGQPISDTCALSLSLWDDPSGGSFLNSNTFNTVPISNGLFTVQVDFGSSTFNGEGRWIETL